MLWVSDSAKMPAAEVKDGSRGKSERGMDDQTLGRAGRSCASLLAQLVGHSLYSPMLRRSGVQRRQWRVLDVRRLRKVP